MKTLLIVMCVSVPSFGAVNVYKSATAPADLETQLVADVTTQYESTVKTGLFGSVNITINKRNQTAPPPPPDGGLATLDTIADKLTAISTLTYVYGYAAGMERERGDVIDLTYQMQGQYFASGVLGGTQTYKVVISTNPMTTVDLILLSTTTARNEVLRVYNNVVNEIAVRYGNVLPVP